MPAKSCTLLPTQHASAPRYIERLLTCAAFSLAVGLIATSTPAHSAEHFATASTASSETVTATAVVADAKSRASLPDGVYLYGQSAKANQVGASYMVFKVNRQQVTGAFYMPSSSFDCFRGELNAEQMAVMVTNSYEQTSYPYSVAVQSKASVATSAGAGTPSLELSGYHRIQSISANDRRILATCQASLR